MMTTQATTRIVLSCLGLAFAASPLSGQSATDSAGTAGNQGHKRAWEPWTVRASVDSTGTQANWYSQNPELSANGRYVVFASNASNLVPGDTNGTGDVFMRDLKRGVTVRVSLTESGGEANGLSNEPAMSPDGRFVAFTSHATNLVPGDTNGKADIYVRDLLTGAVDRVSVSSAGAEADRESYGVALTPDGRFIAYSSEATNLVAGDVNQKTDVFVHDRSSGLTELISIASDGAPGDGTSYYPAISDDGQVVTFSSDSDNFVETEWNPYYQVFARNRADNTTQMVSMDEHGYPVAPATAFSDISADGRFVVFGSHSPAVVAGDSNAAADVFLHDRLTGVTTLVSKNTSGEQGNSDSFDPRISADGQFITFNTIADNLVAGDDNLCPDNFIHDTFTGKTVCLTVTPQGAVGDNFSWPAVISADGRVVAFASFASDLVAGDTNAVEDVFVRILR